MPAELVGVRRSGPYGRTAPGVLIVDDDEDAHLLVLITLEQGELLMRGGEIANTEENRDLADIVTMPRVVIAVRCECGVSYPIVFVGYEEPTCFTCGRLLPLRPLPSLWPGRSVAQTK